MTTATNQVTIRRAAALSESEIAALADVLIDCVQGGASVSFMWPLPADKARAFWHRVGEGVESGARVLLIAEDGGGIIGTVQLVLDLPENQPHRADVSKMLVHRRARRKGVGEALMRRAEQEALALGRNLLVLDTASGDAERLYRRLGWVFAGVIPGYALWPDGGLCPTSLFYRDLA